jgi:hypothetical protein
LRLRAELFPFLPLPTTLCGSNVLSGVVLYLTGSEAVWKALRRCNRVVFGLREWIALVSSFAEGRASAASLDEWCEYKRKIPTWKLSLREAMGIEGAEPGRRWGARRFAPWAWMERRAPCDATVGELFRAWGIQLDDVSYGDEVAL